MKKLNTEFDLIKPESCVSGTGIEAFFTLKNSSYNQGGQKIAGLNLGYNTPENKEQVARNRLLLLKSLNMDPDWTAYADQVHSNRVQFVTQGGTYPETDGLITRIPGLTLAIQVADCAAVLLWDSKNKIIGALHAGWRGAAGNIVPQGIRRMVEEGADPEYMKAFISPCISQKNFEVGTEVADQFPDRFVNTIDFEKPHVDLKGFLNDQLLDEGINQKSIDIRSECTMDNPDNFYSYRREGAQSGRMLALIKINEG